ncbi:transcriptional regulator, MerR family protein [Microbacterium faecale]|uniref:Transcriptional regulator, MerR family protein n=1 Tax=Microbacterium faecale TaxID=1804630 RepID=A0A916YIJ3_9MICO|nr:MerR family transcriptional regulator [Microbacterium faecale]GGD46326.1 transcriptional regulator, MerR family protein [Microbacterium faecale]
MAWSTRELAERAGTTVNTIRHYHRLGLLEEPEREYNGYKQYEVHHLVSLLRIRRLADLGVPLSQIRDVRASTDSTPQTLRELDAELEESIRRLEEARADIAVILRDEVPADTPAGFASVAGRLSETDASILHIYTQLYDEAALADIQKIAEDVEDVAVDLDRLPPDSDEEVRRALVPRLARSLARNLIDYPWLNDPASHLSKSGYVTSQTMIEAIHELYNPAQLDVLGRAHEAARELVLKLQESEEGPESGAG